VRVSPRNMPVINPSIGKSINGVSDRQLRRFVCSDGRTALKIRRSG
jgi:hypothetical protein